MTPNLNLMLKKLLEWQNLRVNSATMKYKHTQTNLVKSFNKVLAKKLFIIQDAQELADSATLVKMGEADAFGHD